MITPSGELTEATFERVFVRPCKESLSGVDRSLFVGDVCRVFGQFVRYDVVYTTYRPTKGLIGVTLP